MPTETTRTKAAAAAKVTPAGSEPSTTTGELDGDSLCDLDGSRLEVYGRTTVGDVTYEVRKCSSDPNHVKQVPL